MTPAARIQAAIEILDRIASGAAAEQALLGWSRGARYAGSKDRAAVRDHVFDVLRRWRSTAAQGGADTGRGRMLGLLRQSGIDPDSLFTGEGHAPEPLSDAEHAAGRAPEGAEALDLPDWLADVWTQSLGDAAEPSALALRQRAPVYLRVNTAKLSVPEAQALLAAEGIKSVAHPLAQTALQVTGGARGVARSKAYLDGLVELQDVASQAIALALPLEPGSRVLDYCAGGGGKALAMAARSGGAVDAHDADPARMKDLPARAQRAGAQIRVVAKPQGRYDVVLCDVPCSGAGAWRRAPEGKWRLTAERLRELTDIQSDILQRAAPLVAAGGTLAYATCSMLYPENTDRIAQFTADMPGWKVTFQRQFLPSDGGDGFFLTCLTAPA
ncbi:RsmB/NOP family class I SAM-dependent RNA methyltransferase [Salipiger sp. 1_MG-2023]|uniref:RsmB/NOP family class I SAM-dependent RNA methyltransferase n=1 Tax=Salipiger sp. 1_MG-2023 TaxID=3062665 RepID=UPI0026E39F9F|nr:RsmB/NOP family class I SAM-dependent RNA methyltransferase [Salipiger sp. 1_MG-2023]MDO6585887.1 RsmB/NOP family class I SAM-dependent RNA methyltransferase [Salipiger sp. 1_MG-2023]